MNSLPWLLLLSLLLPLLQLEGNAEPTAADAAAAASLLQCDVSRSETRGADLIDPSADFLQSVTAQRPQLRWGFILLETVCVWLTARLLMA